MLIINKVEPVKIRKEELGKEQQKDFLNRYCTKKGKKEEKKKEGLGEEQQSYFLAGHSQCKCAPMTLSLPDPDTGTKTHKVFACIRL